MEYDTQLRLLLLGDGGAGKSSLLTRFTDDTFVPQTSTVGVDFRTKLITLMWQRVRLQLWDTNGQERFRSITRSYYRGAHGVALVFDTCDTISFGNVSRWVADIRQHKTVEDIVIIICANKVRRETFCAWPSARCYCVAGAFVSGHLLGATVCRKCTDWVVCAPDRYGRGACHIT